MWEYNRKVSFEFYAKTELMRWLATADFLKNHFASNLWSGGYPFRLDDLIWASDHRAQLSM